MEDFNIGEIDTDEWWFIWIISVKNANKVEIDNVEMDVTKIAKME